MDAPRLGRRGQRVTNDDVDVGSDGDCDAYCGRRVAVAINGTHKRNAQELNATNYCLFVLVELIGRHGHCALWQGGRGQWGEQGAVWNQVLCRQILCCKIVNSNSNLFIATARGIVLHSATFGCFSPAWPPFSGCLFVARCWQQHQQQQQQQRQQQRQFYRYSNKNKGKRYKSYFRFYLAAFSL